MDSRQSSLPACGAIGSRAPESLLGARRLIHSVTGAGAKGGKTRTRARSPYPSCDLFSSRRLFPSRTMLFFAEYFFLAAFPCVRKEIKMSNVVISSRSLFPHEVRIEKQYSMIFFLPRSSFASFRNDLGRSLAGKKDRLLLNPTSPWGQVVRSGPLFKPSNKNVYPTP